MILGVALIALALAAPAVARTAAAAEQQSGWVGGLCRGLGGVADSLAELFGISADELARARDEGKTLSDLAQEKGVSEERVLNTVLAGRREALNKAVAEGRVTQQQADAMLERMETRAKNALDGSLNPARGCGASGGASGGAGGGPGWRQGGCGAPGAGTSGGGCNMGGSGGPGSQGLKL
jgi:uncharacterized protein YidB (DUF937 family)